MQKEWLQRAILLAKEGMENNKGGPFGCVVVCNGQVVGDGNNQVTSSNDPTAHAEIVAIRQACAKLNTFLLDDCELYASCEPCPMCLSAIYWARIPTVYFAATRHDAAKIGFDDALIYQQLELSIEQRQIAMQHCPDELAQQVFDTWHRKVDKVRY